ncbi:flagellar motor switch protein FliG [Actibacterium ureilyticum]|uniref:flagellar motor switch protein FliG n=1 Tax=Actibacterium ureilyticum TaxID=1590614 RepID=UPI001FE60F7B|nr:FliG C-terminal domain-containing protein [Actibacterium ureilyticum]
MSTQTAPAAQKPALNRRRKAAIIVRLLLNEGMKLPLDRLPGALQADLTSEIGSMRYIDAETVTAVVGEFLEELGRVGLTFPGGLDGALALLDGHISAEAADSLRPVGVKPAPWPRLAALPIETLAPAIAAESTEVAAVILSKLDTALAARILGQIPGDRARRIAYAVSLTGRVDPDTVQQIGETLVAQMERKPVTAFDLPPEDRIGAILNLSPSATRDSVLAGLEDDDAGFAAGVRKAIFTFDDIPARLPERQVPSVTRAVAQDVLVTALAGAAGVADAAADFILSNMSQRMADQLREEMEERGKVKLAQAEEAMAEIVQAIRSLESSGEVTLIQPDEAEAETA